MVDLENANTMILVFTYKGPPGLRSQALQAARKLAGLPDKGEDPWDPIGILVEPGSHNKWALVRRMEELGYLFISASLMELDE